MFDTKVIIIETGMNVYKVGSTIHKLKTFYYSGYQFGVVNVVTYCSIRYSVVKFWGYG